MLIAWRYREKDTIYQRFDPRARLIFMLLLTLTTWLVWDLRWVLVILGISVIQYVLARISLRESWQFWVVIGLMAISLSIISSITGSRMTGYVTEEHTLFTGSAFRLLFWDITPTISAEALVFLVTQVLRIFIFGLLAVVIPYTINPSHYGITFRGLKLPDKFAFAMDLSFRLVPTVGRDFSIIMDAQRARGYEIDKLKGGILQKVRKMAPLIVPLVIGTIIGGEDIADAMDLRAFGIGPRTWLSDLKYTIKDRILIILSFLVFIVTIVARLGGTGISMVWVPQFLLNLAGG